MLIDSTEQQELQDGYGRSLSNAAMGLRKTVLRQRNYCVSTVLCMISSSACAEMSLVVHALHMQTMAAIPEGLGDYALLRPQMLAPANLQ